MRRVKGAKIVVTGGAGFIGGHLVRALLDEGADHITIVDDLRAGDRARLPLDPRVTLREERIGGGPINFEEASLLFHFAAEKHNASRHDPHGLLETNVLGTQRVLEAAARAGVQKVVFASSLFAHGRTSGAPLVESERATPNTVYGASKLCGEHLLDALGRATGIETVALRFFFVYGPMQFAGAGYKSVIVKSFEHLLRGEPPIVFGDGAQTLDYIYIDDAVRAAILAAESDVTAEVIHIGSGEPTTVASLVDKVMEIAGSDLKPESGPKDETHGTRRVADTAKAEALLGFRAKVTLEAGLSATFQWMKDAQSASRERVA
jgi:UDP-glucose 4-epimerase